MTTNRSQPLPHRFAWSAVPLLCLLLLLGGCDEGELLPPDPEAGDLFARYVALGNSITAGFQSDGINAETQAEAYPVLLAQQMGHEVGETFNIPALAPPGCPPPLTNVFTGERRGDEACELREQPVPTTIHNVAVPGAALADVLTNDVNEDANPNALTTLILGGRTQLEAAAEAQPTFVSVWIGNNDVLGAALSGTAVEGTTFTPPSTFEQGYETLRDRLQALEAEGGVLVGVANVTLIPYLSPGAAYFAAAQEEALPESFEVADTCAPASLGGVGESTLVPFGYGFGFLLPAAQAGTPVTLDCTDDRPLAEIYGPENVPGALAAYSILTEEEIAELAAAVQAYNTAIASAADDLGWAYVDPNALFEREEIAAQLPPFPNLSNPDQPFGPFFSLDGVHPSREGHALVAEALIQAINEAYGTEIPPASEAQ